MKLFIFCVGLLLILAIIVGLAMQVEARNYNKGVCIKCGNKLQQFDTDSQGNRGYICNNCSYTTWVSYPIDKHHSNK